MDTTVEDLPIPPEDTIRQSKDSPFLIIDQYAPRLDHVRMHELIGQWKNFWEVRSNGINTPPLTNIPKGAFVHNARFSDDLLSTVLESGILSGEVGYGAKQTIPEDAETHLCSDFFVNDGERSVSQYQEYINERDPKFEAKGIRKKRMEYYSSPDSRNDCIAFIVDSKQEPLQGLLDLSAKGDSPGRLSAFGVRFPYPSNRLASVLIGVPANMIGMMVVGGKISSNQEVVSRIKTEIISKGLNFPLVDISGNII